MDFPDALRKVDGGERITKLEWNDQKTWVEMKDGFLCLCKGSYTHALMVSEGDMTGDDWVVVGDQE